MISDTPAWKALAEHAAEVKATHLRELLADDARNAAMRTQQEGIYLDFSRQNATTKTLDLLFELAEAAELKKKLSAIASGEHVNATEDRAVMHMALRAPKTQKILVDGHDVVPDVHEVLDAIRAFSSKVRDGQFVGATGKQLKNVISIGIGGSYLGPEFVFEALRDEPVAKAAADGRSLRFLANVDPVDVARATRGLNPEETLVVVVSKTFTTAETMLNARTLRKWLVDDLTKKGCSEADAVAKHMVAASSAVPLVQQFGIDRANIFGFWDWVGGRYSVTSAVGILPLALQYGFDITEKFLAGAHAMDKHLLEAPLRSNLPVIINLPSTDHFGAMFRATSTRKGRWGYDQLISESTFDGDQLSDAKMIRSTTLPANFFGDVPVKLVWEPKIPVKVDIIEKQVKKVSKVHPLFSLFEKRSRKKKATAKPEFSRYMQYLKEGGIWDAKSSKPVIY